MKLQDLFVDNDFSHLTESLTRRAALSGLGSAIFAPKSSEARTKNGHHDTIPTPPEHLKIDKTNQNILINFASRAGIRGNELAAFLAQTAHESGGFNSLEEKGSHQYFLNYANLLGNVEPGDGERYRGRGFIHLTGRKNYADASKITNVNLELNPTLASDIDLAAQIAVWYWKNRVRPHIKNWDDVSHITELVSGNKKTAIEQRRANYKYYKALISYLSKHK